PAGSPLFPYTTLFRSAYVLGRDQKLLGVVSINELFVARPDRLVSEVMSSEDLVTVPEEMDQEKISYLFGDTGLIAIPVVDSENRSEEHTSELQSRENL